MYNRINLIQDAINKVKAKRYLEIGVFKGFSFLKIKCQNKIGVDPKIMISKKQYIKSYLTNLSNLNNKFYEMKSDDFFDENRKSSDPFYPEVVFIDGLHTFQQSLKDVVNTLNIIDRDGYIIVHDCNPPSEASSVKALSVDEAKIICENKNISGWNDEWCGDVWKTILYLKDNFDDLLVRVIDTDYGLGIIKKTTKSKKKYKVLDNLNKYEKLSFSDLEKNKEEILNLTSVKDVPSLFQSL